MAIVGKNKLNHPALGTAGGNVLHGQIESLWSTVSDNIPSRWSLVESVAVFTTTTIEHNLQVPFADLRVFIYIKGASTNTRATDFSAGGWSIIANAASPQTKIDVRTPTYGGPYNFYVFMIHAPVDDKLSLSGGTMSGSLTLSADPTQAYHAVTKQYVDALAEGLDVKASVRYATTASIILGGTQTVDGFSSGDGLRILVKNQSNPAQNGLYVSSSSGNWTRAADANVWSEHIGAFVFIEEGSTLADTGWVCTANTGGIFGTTPIYWTQFSSAGSVVGDGSTITMSGLTASVKLDASSNTLTSTTSGIKVRDGGLSNQHIASGAAIDGSKINPAFGSQSVTADSFQTSGPVIGGELSTSGKVSGNFAEANYVSLTPWSPTAASYGRLNLYCGSDNEIYKITDAGVSTKVGAVTTSSNLSISDAAPLNGSRNLFINGGLQVKQRAAAVTSLTANVFASFVRDRWLGVSYGSNATVSYSGNIITLTGSANNQGAGLAYRMEALHAAQLNGKTVTISFNASTNNDQYVYVNVNYANAMNNFSTPAMASYERILVLGSTTQRYQVQMIMPNSPDGILFEFLADNLQNSTSTMSLSDFQLEISPIATAFDRRPYELELERCQRYYLETSSSVRLNAVTGAADDGNLKLYMNTPKNMLGVPKITHGTGTLLGKGLTRSINARSTASSTGVTNTNNQILFTATAATGMGIYQVCDAELSSIKIDAEI